MSKAAEFAEKGRGEGDETGCFGAGVAYSRIGDPRALKAFRRACDADQRLSCANLGLLYAYCQGVEKDEERGKKLLRKSCDKGVNEGCAFLEKLGD